MAQSNALREQPSMDEILASIRRIIDTGESQSKVPPPKAKVEDAVVEATIPPPAANDAEAGRPRVPQASLPNAPRTEQGSANAELKDAVSAYLETERSASGQPQPAGGALAEPDAQDFPEPDISEVEAALRAEFNPVDRDILNAERQAKYDARFTEADDGVFRQVGSLLRGKVDDAVRPESGAMERRGNALVSETVSQSVSQSLASLSDLLSERNGRDLDIIAEDMLRPMLQEWLDNNLPSLVERLVRSEIERIARGESRVA